MDVILNELNKLSFLTAPIFYRLLYMSLTAVCIGIIIMLIRRFADKKVAPVWKYILWGLVLVALLVPYRPQSDLALLPATLQIEDISYREQFDNINSETKIISQTENPTGEELKTIDTMNKQQTSLYYKSLIFDVVLPLIWFFGMVATCLFLTISRINLSLKIARHTIAESAQYDQLLQESKDALGIKSDIKLVVQNYISSPALIGLFRAKIILPEYVAQLGEESLRYIFLHELSHFKRKDMFLIYLMLALQAIYWFNPLIWLLFKYFREDIEVLNDACALKHIGIDNEKKYAHSLVEILGYSHHISFTSKLLCMVDGKANLERRITMIKLGAIFKKHKIAISVVCLVVICIISVLLLTQARFSTYKGDIFSMRYPKSWILVDGNLSQEELISVRAKTGVDQESIDQLLSSFMMFFIDTENSTGEKISMFNVYSLEGSMSILVQVDDSGQINSLYQGAFSKAENFSFLEYPYVKELGANEYTITTMRVNETWHYSALLNRHNPSYEFSYVSGSGSVDEETVKVLEDVLSSIKLTT